MRTVLLLLVASAQLFVASWSMAEEDTIEIAELKRDTPVSFAQEVLPILRRNCLACHNNTDAESDLVLETPAAILKGGSEGAAAVAGKGAESLILKVAARQAEPIMPPEDNDVGAEPLTPEELGLLKLWIDQGATGDAGDATQLNWQPLPDGVNPIYSVAVSPDGQYVAAGRANQIFVYHVPSKREIGRLTDPQLLKSGVYKRPGVAHLDLVQSLRFSPDNQLLASGGYRTVKIWRRARNERKLSISDLETAPTTVEVSPDGKTVAVGQESGRVLLFSGINVEELVGHQGAVTGLRFLAQGARIVTSSADNSIRIWQTADATPLAIIETPSAVNDVEVLNDESQLASAGADHLVRIWSMPAAEADAGSGADVQLLHILKGHSGPVTSLGVLDGQLVSGAQDGTLRMWKEGQEVRQISHGGPVEAIAVSPDGSRLASASSNSTAKLWDGEGKQLAELKGDFRLRLQVEEVERTLAIAKRQIENTKADLKAVSDRKTAEEKNAKSAAEARKKAAEELTKKQEAAKKAEAEKAAAETKLAESKAGVTQAEEAKKNAAAVVALSSETIIKADADLQLAAASLKSAEEMLAAAQAAMQKALAAKKTAAERKQQALAVKAKAEKDQQQADSEIKAAQQLVKTSEEQLKKATESSTKSANETAAAQKTLASAERTAQRAVASVKKVSEQIPGVEKTVKQAEKTEQEIQTQLAKVKQNAAAGEQPFRAIAFSLDGKTVAVGGDDQIVRTWDAATGSALDAFAGHAAKLRDLTFTPAGDVVSVAADKTAFLWNTNPEWQLDHVLGSPESAEFVDRVTALDFSPDSKLLATGGGEPSRSGELKIFSVADGALVREIPEAHSDTVFGLEFSPDGQQLASCGADRFAKIFEVESGEFVRAFEGHTHHVLGVSWRADGRLLATSGADKVIKIWDVRTGDQKRTISGFGKEVTAIRFVSTTDNVVASSGDKSVQMKNTNNGGNVRGFSGASDFMYSVMSSGNGKLIVAGGQDSVVRVWSDDGKVLTTFAAPQKEDTTGGG